MAKKYRNILRKRRCKRGGEIPEVPELPLVDTIEPSNDILSNINKKISKMDPLRILLFIIVLGTLSTIIFMFINSRYKPTVIEGSEQYNDDDDN